MGSERLRLGGGELIIDISRSRHCFPSFSKDIVLPNVFLPALFLSGSDHDDQRPISLCFCSEPGQIWSLKMGATKDICPNMESANRKLGKHVEHHYYNFVCFYLETVGLLLFCLFAEAASSLLTVRRPQPALTAALLGVCCSCRCCSAADAAGQFHSKGFLTSHGDISLHLLIIFHD